MEAMALKDFRGLGKRDFENGAVLDAIAQALKEREIHMKKESDVPRLEINEYELHKEWKGQPRQRRIWGVKHADALKEFDDAKSAWEVVKAEVDKTIRDQPEQFGLKGKLTEVVIANTVLMSIECKEATRRLNEARHAGRVLEAAVKGFDHRKTALEKIVDLQGRDYFAEPRASEESRGAVERMERRAARSKGVKRD